METVKHPRWFPVVYANVDQQSLRSETYKGGVYFTEKDLFKFTSKLGILRLHTQKLGRRLQAVPLLGSPAHRVVRVHFEFHSQGRRTEERGTEGQRR